MQTTRDAVARTLAKAAEQAEPLILCGARSACGRASRRAGHPAGAVGATAAGAAGRFNRDAPTLPHTPVVVRPLRDRLETVLADLPPPLYVAGEVVSREPLGDHDVKRLLAAYGVRVSRKRQSTRRRRLCGWIWQAGTPVVGAAGTLPMDDVSKLVAAEARDGVLCQTQAEVKRQTAQFGTMRRVFLREVPPKGLSLRRQR